MNRPSRYSDLANNNVLAFVRAVIVACFVLICNHATLSESKIFDRCELAQLLRYSHGLEVYDVANWVCIAQHSSSLNTSAFGGNARSGSHGLFQISDQYWCSPPGKGVACGVSCDKLRDDDIGDDLKCVQMIHAEHQRLSGDGYNAWIAYKSYCQDNPYEYVEDCFGNEEREYLHSKSIAANSIDDDDEEEDLSRRGKVYGRCELAQELHFMHKVPIEEVPTWVCIAQHESNFDTSAVGRLNADGSADHGIFQISDLYWCSHKGSRRKACKLPCHKLLDSDITDDLQCVRQIYNEHTRISGDGFTAWTVYNAYCNRNTLSYISGCFDGIDVAGSNVQAEYVQKSPKKTVKKGNQKSNGKVYDACELADELRNKHSLPEDQIATWVCIAKHESGYNTSAIGYGDHGLFQISDIYWCSPPGKGWACGLSCADLEDSDISDDVECIKKIYKEHEHLSGDGFKAWTVYPLFCSDGRAEKYISDCPKSGSRPRPAVTAPTHISSKQKSANLIEEEEPKRGKIYGRCELAQELLNKYEMSMEEIPTWVCIAHHESSYDTSAVGRLNTDGSADHGLFQISDLYWCSHKKGHRKACGLPCSKLLDNDITDDIQCVKQIYDEHTRISGNGFTAWTVYNAYCQERTEQYIRGCFDGSALPADFEPAQSITDIGFLPKNKKKGKVYQDCELAEELRDKFRVPKDQIATWVCIAQHQSGLNTSSSGNGVHGLFHISDEFWCSPPGKGSACGLHCSDLEDSDISDDIDCIQKIYLEHQQLSGNGFNAWVVYSQYCSDGKADDVVGHCPGFESSRKHIQQGKTIDIRTKPVFDHLFGQNPFLKHYDVMNNEEASKYFEETGGSGPDAGTNEINENFSSDHEYHANPFLKFVSSDKVKAEGPFIIHEVPTAKVKGDNINPFLKRIPSKEEPTKASHKFSTTFFGISVTPTPTSFRRPPTYPFQNVIPTSQQFGLHPLSKQPEGRKTTFAPRITTSSPHIFGKPSRHTPTRPGHFQGYQPKSEEKAKFDAFKALQSTPILLQSTQTPRVDRLKPYQLSFLPTAEVTIQSTVIPTTNRLQPYQFRTYEPTQTSVKPTAPAHFTSPSYTRPFSFATTPIAQPKQFTSAIPTSRSTILTPTTPTLRTTLQPATKVKHVPGRYDPGRYEAGKYNPAKYDTGRYDPQKHNQQKGQPTTKSPSNLQKLVKSTVVNLGQYPSSSLSPTPAPQTKVSLSTRITSLFEPFKPITFTFTTKAPVTSSMTSAYIFGSPTSSGQPSISDFELVTTPIPSTFALSSTTTKPTKKYDPFKPFGSTVTSYNPFDVFNTRKPQKSAQIKAAPSHDLAFAQSLNTNRETSISGNRKALLGVDTYTTDSKFTSTTKRETKLTASTRSLPTTTRSVTIIKTKPTQAVTAKPIFPASGQPNVKPKSSQFAAVTKPAAFQGFTGTRSVGTISTTKPVPGVSAKSSFSVSSQFAVTPKSTKITPKPVTNSIPKPTYGSIQPTKPTLKVAIKTSTPVSQQFTTTRPVSTKRVEATKASQFTANPQKPSFAVTLKPTTGPLSRPTVSTVKPMRLTTTPISRPSTTTRSTSTKRVATPKASQFTAKPRKPLAAVTPKPTTGSLPKPTVSSVRPTKPTSVLTSRQFTTIRSASTKRVETTKTTTKTPRTLTAVSSKPTIRSLSKPTINTVRPTTLASGKAKQFTVTPKTTTAATTKPTTRSLPWPTSITTRPTTSTSRSTPFSRQFTTIRTPSTRSSSTRKSSTKSTSTQRVETTKAKSVTKSGPTTSAPIFSFPKTTKPFSTTTTKATLSATSARSPTSPTPERSLPTASAARTTIKTTASIKSARLSLGTTRSTSKRPLTASVTRPTTTTTRSTTKSISAKSTSKLFTTNPTTSPAKTTFTTTKASPTKWQQSSESSTKSSRLNIFDLYLKLHGVHPPTKQVSQTSHTNAVTSRTS